MRTILGGLAVAALVACGPSVSGGLDGGNTGETCTTENETRCVGQGYQVCRGGNWQIDTTCDASKECDPSLGCVDCRPSLSETCVGNDVYSCNSDGTIGGFVESCGQDACLNGSCSDDCTADGADLIYVVDDAYAFYSFDPRKLGTEDPFTLIGNLNCGACTAWPEWAGGCTPFSMSVDRNGTAWVLYTSGDIFHVDVTTAACSPSGFSKGQSPAGAPSGGFKLFGMGFVSDSAGGNAETLYIAGGPVDAMGATGHLGRIDPGTMQVTNIGALQSAEFSPELTGTGDAELFGYYPGLSSSMIANLSKVDGQRGQAWTMNGLGGDVAAWAFAHWGGKFYVFASTSDIIGGITSDVLLMDPDGGGSETVVLPNHGHTIVGAGVSTCAPVYVP